MTTKIQKLEELVKTLNNKNNELETSKKELETRKNELDSKISHYIGLYSANYEAQTEKVNLVVNGINQIGYKINEIGGIIEKIPTLNQVCGSENINPKFFLTTVNN